MNKKQRDHLYMTATNKLLLQNEKKLEFNNGEVLLMKLEEGTYLNGFFGEVPAMVIQVGISNLEGKKTYLGSYYKKLDKGQTVLDVLNAEDMEKINFILKKEEGLLTGSSYHLMESYGGKISTIASETLKEYAIESFHFMKQEVKQYQKELKEKNK